MVKQQLKLNSVGIDIGTTTTQVVFSELWVEDTMPGQRTSRLQITKREVVHRGEIYFTPVMNHTTIDAIGVKKLIERQFQLAGIDKDKIDTGAVIITGQNLKKENAAYIAHMLADIAGDFVVAIAGPHIESYLAGRGSGAARHSQITGKTLVNIDIGGGTSNIAVYKAGVSVDSACLNIGGRGMKICSDGTVIQIIPEWEPLLRKLGLDIKEKQKASLTELSLLCDALADILYKAVFQELNSEHGSVSEEMSLYETEPLSRIYQVDEIMFSGGVADHIFTQGTPGTIKQVARYGDIGPLLGMAVRKRFAGQAVPMVKPMETIRATVTGAGAQSMRISGSTVLIDPKRLPMKNIPVIKISGFHDHDVINMHISRVLEEAAPPALALALEKHHENFRQIRESAEKIHALYQANGLEGLPLVVISRQDCGLVLGQCLAALGNKKIISIDQIDMDEGDYIDIGIPLAGQSVPVVVKTLLFN